MKYENDLVNSALMLGKLLDHESKLSGLNLAASSEQSYIGE